ncbi:MAG: NUDIX domain-containing protein [Verrucomicrobia bacterium]|nr:MAG: NUDIX domain-containing protein [Verrucomicrobiota bacterium]
MDLKVKDYGEAQSGDELFDVVDEHDHVVGQARRADVHAQKLRHRAVHVVCVNRRGEVFLQRRSLRKDSAPGRWCASCSGHLDRGESYLAAAVRELGEEIGVQVAGPEALSPWLHITPRRETGMEFVWVYRLACEGPFILDPAEVMDGRWFSRGELTLALSERPREFAGAFRYLWPRLEW